MIRFPRQDLPALANSAGFGKVVSFNQSVTDFLRSYSSALLPAAYDSGIMGKGNAYMSKRSLFFAAAAAYEIIRLYFVLTLQTGTSSATGVLSWYAAVPLLMLPFFLLYAMEKGGSEKAFAANLYGIIKIAGAAGFALFVCRTFLQTDRERHLFINRFVSLKIFIFIMLFFVIDVILAAAVMIKNYKQNKTTEGEPCK